MDTTLRTLIYEHAGGIRDNRALKAVIPGGSSVPMLAADQIDCPLTFEGIQEAGSLLGSGSVIVMDETVCMVWAARNMVHFYRHESCGQCTPCRQGGAWIYKILDRLEAGQGKPEDLDLLVSIKDQMSGTCICALGESAYVSVMSGLKHFRQEYEQHIELGRCPFEMPYRELP
jgi:NADH-quinone oxidoreductase subunit F